MKPTDKIFALEDLVFITSHINIWVFKPEVFNASFVAIIISGIGMAVNIWLDGKDQKLTNS